MMSGSKAAVQVVSFGLTAVNHSKWDGWDGACPGCDVDLSFLTKAPQKVGANVTSLYNPAATWGSIERNFKKQAKWKPEVICLMHSSHGGQVKDLNGDEEDDLDETICTWDRNVTDDDVGNLMACVSSSTLIFFYSDSCHSETAFRAGPNVGAAIRGRVRWMPHIVRHPIFTRHAEPIVRAAISAPLIRWAGSIDSGYSWGGPDGGVWTNAIRSIYDKNASTYGKPTFDLAARKMPRNQKPVYVEFGNVTDAHRTRIMFK